MKPRLLCRLLASVCLVIVVNSAAQAGAIAEVVLSEGTPHAPLTCVKFNAAGAHEESALVTDHVVFRLLIPGCIHGCPIFEARMQPGFALQLGGSAAARISNVSARSRGGIALLELRSVGHRVRWKFEACGDFNEALSTVMGVEIVFGSHEDENFYAKGEWVPKLSRGRHIGWQLSRRAAMRQ